MPATENVANDEIVPGKGLISIMHAEHGDLKVMWDPRNEVETAAAKKQFDEMRDKGYKAFRVAAKGEPGEKIGEFDPREGAIIMMKQFVGG